MTSFDLLVVAVLILSTGFAVVRGAIRELGTLAALGGAGGLAVLLVRPIQAFTGVGQSFLATAMIGGVLAVIGFVLLYALLHLVLTRFPVKGRAVNIDRVAGGVFGFSRGLVLVGLGFLAYGYYLDEARRPESVNAALTLPIAKGVAAFFEGFAPPETNLDPGKAVAADENAAADGYARGDRSALSEIVTTVTTTEESNTNADDTSLQSDDDPIADVLEESDSE